MTGGLKLTTRVSLMSVVFQCRKCRIGATSDNEPATNRVSSLKCLWFNARVLLMALMITKQAMF